MDHDPPRARLFRNGGSQAVRLPRAFRFREDQKEVLVSRSGRGVLLEPPDQWSDAFRDCLGAWREGIERPPQSSLAELLGRRR